MMTAGATVWWQWRRSIVHARHGERSVWWDAGYARSDCGASELQAAACQTKAVKTMHPHRTSQIPSFS